MQGKSPGVDDPGRWMDFAQEDLRIAKKGKILHFRREALCFHAQQAAEKAIKAVLLSRLVPFPRSHQLQDLFDLLPADLLPSADIRKAAALSVYAQSGRYPLNFEDVTEKEYQEAVKQAEKIVEWAKKILKASDGSQPPSLHETQAVYRSSSRKTKGGMPLRNYRKSRKV